MAQVMQEQRSKGRDESRRTTVLGRIVRRAGVAIVTTAMGMLLLTGSADAATFVDTYNLATHSTFYSTSDPGEVNVVVNCDSATRTAYVFVDGKTPWAFPKGLYFYTQVFAKNHQSTTWSLMAQGQVFRKTISTFWSDAAVDYVTMNEDKPLLNTSFTGAANAQYDVLVKYWWAPAGATWRGPISFQAGTYNLFSKIGLSYPGTTCYFSA